MRRALPLLAVACLAFAPAPFHRDARVDAGKEDLRRMQGEWVVVSRTRNGGEVVSPDW